MEATRTSDCLDLQFDHLPAQAVLRVRVRGTVTLAGLLSIAGPVHAHPAFAEVAGVLYDMRAARQAFDTAQLRHFTERLAARPEPRGYRVAYLVDSDLAFGMARMIEALAEGVHDRPRMVFREEAAALAWLAAPPADVRS